MLLAFAVQAAQLDLSRAVVVAPSRLNAQEQKAVTLLVEEVEKRTGIRLPLSESPPPDTAVIQLDRQPEPAQGAGRSPASALRWSGQCPSYKPESYRLRSSGSSVTVIGCDARGLLYGIGRLLRELSLQPGSIALPRELDLASAPRFPVRGHQLAYRPKTNTYDAWTPAQFEQYVRDLAVFGANSIEILPPRTDDADTSPHMKVPKLEMMVGLSRMIASYGLDVWIWYPNMAQDYADPKTVEAELAERREIFQKLPRIDAVFVPGGDPGDVPPRALLTFLAKVAAALREYHPKAKIWISPQNSGPPPGWLESLYDIIRKEQPKWLGGVVFGPWVKTPLPELRKIIPPQYPIRRYPDITHTLSCQYPVPQWDAAFAATLGREPINPRPRAEAHIHNLFQDYAVGSITYSEGVNDDVNKIVWSALDWDPAAPVEEVLRQYSRYFIGEDYADDFAQGLLALERNWEGPAATNGQIEVTLQQWQELERRALKSQARHSESPEATSSLKPLENWRFQQPLLRAYYDAYVRRRLLHETEFDERAREELRRGNPETALGLLQLARRLPAAPEWRRRIGELARSLFESIGAQLSVPKYQALAVRRGAFLDSMDDPLSDGPWLAPRIEHLQNLPPENRAAESAAVLGRTNPGPGGFYDHLGSPAGFRRVRPGQGWEKDPGFLRSPLIGFNAAGPQVAIPLAWRSWAETLYDTPLTISYEGLDPGATYVLRVVYGRTRSKMRLVANGRYEVHPPLAPPAVMAVQEFPIPPQATAPGRLELTWTAAEGAGCRVSEVWLVKQQPRMNTDGHR